VCEKFPFYVGSYIDARMLQVTFCPRLKELAAAPESTDARLKQ